MICMPARSCGRTKCRDKSHNFKCMCPPVVQRCCPCPSQPHYTAMTLSWGARCMRACTVTVHLPIQFQCDVTGASDTSLRVVPDWVLDMQRNVVSITGWLVVVEPVACILTSSFDMPVGSDDYSQVRTML